MESAFPLWMERGVDWAGVGFFDSLDQDRAENASDIKRVRTLTRQIYAFCEAAPFSVPRAREAVDHGLNFLLGAARRPGGGFYSAFDLAGRPTNDELDTYDLAFVLFALRHAYRLTAEQRLADEAHSLLAFMERALRDEQGGFAEGEPPRLPRRQNPHMHLFEACLAWMEVDQHGAFRRVADELVHLFETRFVDTQTGAIFEYFGSDLRFDPSTCREAVEPGHIFEWIWLLSRYDELTGHERSALHPRLYAFAHRHAVDRETGLLLGEIDRLGTVRERAVRLWPHAEWLRTEVLHLRTEPHSGTRGALNAFDALWRFLDAGRPGLWRERYDPDTGGFSLAPAPATSLYHIVGAMTALIDLAAEWENSPRG